MIIENGPYCVYVHINKINSKMYVGQTCKKPERRWGNNGNYYKQCTLFWNAICKYGWNNFEHEIVASNLTKKEADGFERLLINKLNTMDPNYGYNLQSGGGSGNTPSEDVKRKIGNAQRGKKASEETKRKMREAHKAEKNHFYGKHHSEETKKSISKKNSGKNNPNYGKCHSEETRRKQSEANKIAKEQLKKPVLQYTKDGVFVRKWDCAYSAARELGILRSNICGCCLKRYGCKSAGGFVWRYENDAGITQNNN